MSLILFDLYEKKSCIVPLFFVHTPILVLTLLKVFIDFLSVGLSSIFQSFRSMVSILTFFSNARISCLFKKKSPIPYTHHTFHKARNFINTEFYKLKLQIVKVSNLKTNKN
jgi:hypothetical protein